MTYLIPTLFVVVISVLFYEVERVVAPQPCPRSNRVSLWCYRLTGIWCLLWILVPTPSTLAAQAPLPTEVVRNQEQVNALRDRVSALEAQRLDARISSLENVPMQLDRLQSQVWGVLGGMVLLAAGQIFQLRRQKT